MSLMVEKLHRIRRELRPYRRREGGKISPDDVTDEKLAGDEVVARVGFGGAGIRPCPCGRGRHGTAEAAAREPVPSARSREVIVDTPVEMICAMLRAVARLGCW